MQTVTSASISELEKGLRKVEIDKELHKPVNMPHTTFVNMLVFNSGRIAIESNTQQENCIRFGSSDLRTRYEGRSKKPGRLCFY